jgi:hypothetical protein
MNFTMGYTRDAKKAPNHPPRMPFKNWRREKRECFIFIVQT